MNELSEIMSTTGEAVAPHHKDASTLHHVDNLEVHATSDIGNARVTAIAQQLLDYDPEAMVWQDSPSLALMFGSLLKWLTIVVIWLVALAALSPPAPVLQADIAQPPQVTVTEKDQHAHSKKTPHGKKGQRSTNAGTASAEVSSTGQNSAQATTSDDTWYLAVKWLGILVVLYQIYKHFTWALRLKSFRYQMSSQRLIIESGIFSKATNTYELRSLGAGQIQSPFLLRIFGRSNLYVGVWLSGIRNAGAVRDLIRNAGQIEASRLEKVRWR